jgi:phosphoribosylformylglycinamidine synthase
MQSITRFAGEGGKVLGVCNGFQILCESNLLPGALLRNANQQFISKNVFLRGTGDNGQALKIPIAHGEGRFYADEKLLNELEANGQVLYRYSDESGKIIESANPNGSFRNIAGICNKAGNVIGMMPHPERACSEALGNTDGKAILKTLFIDASRKSVHRQTESVNF